MIGKLSHHFLVYNYHADIILLPNILYCLKWIFPSLENAPYASQPETYYKLFPAQYSKLSHYITSCSSINDSSIFICLAFTSTLRFRISISFANKYPRITSTDNG